MQKKKSKLIGKNQLIENSLGFRIQDVNNDCVCINFFPHTSKYLTIVKINGTDIFHFTENDKHMAYENFSNATKALDLPYKYIFTTCKPTLSDQKKQISHKLANARHAFQKQLLERELNRMDYIEHNQCDKLAYLLLFGDSEREVIESAERYRAQMLDVSAELCKGEEQIFALQQILRFDDIRAVGNNIYEQLFPKKLSVHQKYISFDNKYITSFIVYNFPVSMLNLQFASLFNKFDDNVTITLDCRLTATETAVRDITASMRELKGRRQIAQTEADEIDSESALDNLRTLYANISQGSEQLISLTLRFYCVAPSVERLNMTVTNISKQLKTLGIDGYIPENMMLKEYASLICYSNSIGNYFPVEDTFKYQFPFYYQSLMDPGGTWFGETVTHGQVLLNPFLKSQSRISYDLLLAGVKGSGKTITLKSMVADQVMLGNKVFMLDLEGEDYKLAEKLGGKVIRMSRSSTINPLQLRRSVASSDISEESNYISEISRIETFLRQYIPNMDDLEAETLMDTVRDTFLEFGINEATDISGYSNEDFPLMSDVLANIRCKKRSSELSAKKLQVYESLETFVKPLAEGSYASMFNGFTSIDTSGENLIVFDVKSISELPERIFNAFLTNILGIMWSEICDNVRNNENLVNSFDRRCVIAVIDEAHQYINNPYVLAFIEKLLRRSRKYDAALWFGSQSMADYKIDCSSLFALIQYKMLLKQTAESVPLLKELFPQFTESELRSLETFLPGEMLLSLGGGRSKLHCRRLVSDEDLYWLGNSRDIESLRRKGIVADD